MKASAFLLALSACLPLSAVTYDESGGVVMFAAEDAAPANGWALESSHAGYLGTGYYIATTNTDHAGALVYSFQINSAGRYQLNWRNTIGEGTNTTEANDSFVRVLDSGGNPITPVPNDNSASKGWYKTYVNSLDWTWDAKNKDHDPHSLSWNFSAGQNYTLEVSTRSRGHIVDHICFWNTDDHAYANKTTGNASNGQDDDLDTLAGTWDGGSGGGGGGGGSSYVLDALDDFGNLNSGDIPYYKDNSRDALAIDASEEANRSGFAQATVTFNGDSGDYDITITTMTEEDGESIYQLFINGSQVATFQNPYIGPGSSDDLDPYTHTWSDITVNNGDTIAVRSNADTNGEIPEGSGTAWARGRWQQIALAPTSGGGGGGSSDGDGSVTIGGDLMQWHRVDVVQAAVHSSEMANPNPFMDYRFNVTFTSPSGDERVVPGYFAGDNNGGDTGNKWVAHLNPHETGTWTYQVSFRSGNNIAVNLGNTPGSAVSPFNNKSGSFVVGASNKTGDDFRAPSKGMLTNTGNHYLTYGGSGQPFVYTGPGIPENILGYRGFTNTTQGDRHRFDAHSGDWNSGDPNWPDPGTGYDGKNLIGALNYIAEEGANSLYMMSNTIDGDGNDCFPHPTAKNDKQRYDLLKLHQWDLALAHAQAKGIFLHWHLSEHESGNMNYYGSSAIPNDRKLYFRMLNARFGYYNGLKWNLMEECEWDKDERAAQMKYLKDIDPYDHPVTWQAGGIGLPRGDVAENYGDPNMDAGSFQGNPSRNKMFNEVKGYREGSAASGVPLTIAWDEPQKIENDNNDESNGYPMGRRDKMWPCLMAGGDGFMWYIQKDGGGHGFDQNIDDFTIMQNSFNWSGYARDFLEPLPLLDMEPSMSIVDSNTGEDYTLYKSGEVYAIFNDRAGKDMTLDLSGESGTYDVLWFDPRNGGSLQVGTKATVNGGGDRDLGNAPNNTGKDWAVLVRLQGSEINLPPSVSFVTPSNGADFAEPATVNVEVAASDSDGSVVNVELFVDGSSQGVVGSGPYGWSLSGLAANTYTLRAVATDDDGETAETSISITVSGVSTNTPPTVSFDTPVDGDSFTAPATVAIEVLASDSDGTIDSIDLYVNGIFNRTEGRSPYEWSLADLDEGTYTLRAVAFDNDGAEGEASITITVVAAGANTRLISLTVQDGYAVDIVPTTPTVGSSSSAGNTTYDFDDLDPTVDHTLDIMPSGGG